MYAYTLSSVCVRVCVCVFNTHIKLTNYPTVNKHNNDYHRTISMSELKISQVLGLKYCFYIFLFHRMKWDLIGRGALLDCLPYVTELPPLHLFPSIAESLPVT